MSGELIRYEAARYALQVAKNVDEVKDLRDKALALAAYARQAKDGDMIQWATEIKLRAERRAGELLAETDRNTGAMGVRNSAVAHNDTAPPPTLDEIGLTRQQSSNFQAIASVPEPEFEQAVASGKASTASLVRTSPKKKQAAVKEPKPAKPSAQKTEAFESLKVAYAELREKLEEMTDLAESARVFENNEEFKTMQVLRAQLRAMTDSRDQLIDEKAEMMRMVAHWRRRAEKAEARIAA